MASARLRKRRSLSRAAARLCSVMSWIETINRPGSPGSGRGQPNREPAAVAPAILLLERIPPAAHLGLLNRSRVLGQVLGRRDLAPVPGTTLEFGPTVPCHGEKAVVDRDRRPRSR